MKDPEWVRRDVIVAFPERLLSEHGGPAGTRDEGMLDSALGRPQNLFSDGEPTLSELSAAYAFGLARNRPLVDGNKRIAFRADEVEVVLRTLALAAGELTEASYADWLRNNVRT